LMRNSTIFFVATLQKRKSKAELVIKLAWP